MAIGVFGLQVAYKLKRSEIMSLDDTHGWFGGGINPSVPAVYSTIDRVDFSNDSITASPRGTLTAVRYRTAATGNSNYGWFGGGGSTLSIVNRIDFSNDSSRALSRGQLGSGRRSLAATGNSNYGWFGGGIPGPVSSVDRIDFSNDSSTASVRGSLSLARGRLAATGNSNYGWFGGGLIPTPAARSTVDRIDFSNDSPSALVRGPLSAAKYELAATGNSNYGWFGGGFSPSIPGITTTVDRIDFSNDLTVASVRGPLSSSRQGTAATGNSNYGWFGGGAIPAVVATVDRIDFSNDSATLLLRGQLSVERKDASATSGQAKGPAIKLQKAGNYGWFGGGYVNPGYTRVDRIDFSSDVTTASTRGDIPDPRSGLVSNGNSNYGWFSGGQTIGSPGLQMSTIYRLDLSNDSNNLLNRGILTAENRNNTGSVSNNNYGWISGGGLVTVSTSERINFSNDLASTISKGPLSQKKYLLAATGNSNYGWFGAGFSPSPDILYSTVDRIDFSNDSATASVRGPLSLARFGLAATGNSNYGWFGGGNIPGPAAVSTVDRIDFSNDLATASPRGLLTLARQNLAATGNSNYGWFGGGLVPGTPLSTAVATVDRINFLNDSSTATARGLLSLARSNLAATSNSTR